MFAKKSLGQNFLKSPKILNDIVLAGNVSPTDIIFEAGPGHGALTEKLLATGATVIAVEKDRRLIEELTTKFSKEIASKKFTLLSGDALEISPTALGIADKKYKIIANIPYYITGQFIRKFLETDIQPNTVVLMIQKEVAERIVARDSSQNHGEGKESLLSISVKAYGTPRYVATVKAGNFTPVPNVDSAILAIEYISKDFFNDISEKKFFEIIKKGFAHKRKMLAGNLSIESDVLEACGIQKNARAETLSLADWHRLVLHYQS